jgi:hypothetical protein
VTNGIVYHVPATTGNAEKIMRGSDTDCTTLLFERVIVPAVKARKPPIELAVLEDTVTFTPTGTGVYRRVT